MIRLKNKGRGILLALVFLLALSVYIQCGITVKAQEARLDETIDDSELAEDAVEAKTAIDQVADPNELISLDLKGVNIIELFRILSLKTGSTIVPSKGVSGRVTIFLNNIKFEDALDIILVSQNLAMETKGEIIYVMNAEEYNRLYGRHYIEKRKYKSIKLTSASPTNVFNALSQLKSDIGKIIIDEASGTVLLVDTPDKIELMENALYELESVLETAVFDLNYAKAEDIKAHLSEVITPGTGKVIVDERSSKVMVYDLPVKMKKIRKLMKDFDAEEKEVLIAAEIVQVNLNDAFKRGVDWEKMFSDRTGMDGLDLVSKFPVAPTLSFSGKVSVGTIEESMYNVAMEFIQRFGDVKILSRPRIAVINGEEAKIMVGRRDAYVTQTLSQAEASTVTSESIEFIDVGVKLNVTPTINEKGFVMLKIKPEVSSVAETITTSLGSRIPILETSEAETTVKIKDGTMIMIAGLMKEEKRETREGIPGLHKIPFLGGLFGSRSKAKVKTELIIFITPHIFTGEFSIDGAEPVKFIPKEMMTDDIKRTIILEEINKITPEKDPVEEVQEEFEVKDKVKGPKAF
ncbi:MAG: type II secretion system protein GspD [PVC group bacterium]|nr:type II secretion system protein GspD [PVC group bacterium]